MNKIQYSTVLHVIAIVAIIVIELLQFKKIIDVQIFVMAGISYMILGAISAVNLPSADEEDSPLPTEKHRQKNLGLFIAGTIVIFSLFVFNCLAQ